MRIIKHLSFAGRSQNGVTAAGFGQFGQRALWLALSITWALSSTDCFAQSSYSRHADQKRRYLTNSATFETDRTLRMSEHLKGAFYNGETLTSDEQQVATLMTSLSQYFQTNRERADLPPMRPFYEAKSEITKTELFELLKKMPKGGAAARAPVSGWTGGLDYRERPGNAKLLRLLAVQFPSPMRHTQIFHTANGDHKFRLLPGFAENRRIRWQREVC